MNPKPKINEEENEYYPDRDSKAKMELTPTDTPNVFRGLKIIKPFVKIEGAKETKFYGGHVTTN